MSGQRTQHNTLPPASALPRNARSDVDRTNHETSASRCHLWCTVYSTFSTQQDITIFENMGQEFSPLKTGGATAEIYYRAKLSELSQTSALPFTRAGVVVGKSDRQIVGKNIS